MKLPGNSPYFTHKRNRELMAAFRKVLAERRYFNIKKDFEQVVNMPCSRFWVSEDRATAVISALIRGQPVLETMRPTKREMFLEIYRRVLVKKNESPDMPLCDIVFYVVNSPAPKFYMKPKHASNTVYKIKRGHYKK